MTSLCKWSKLVVVAIFILFHECTSGLRINEQFSGVSRECGSFAAIVSLAWDGLSDHVRENQRPLTENGGMAALHHSATNLGSSSVRCGASLISDRYLLTAAHCVDGIQVSSVSISLGREDLNENPGPGPDTYEVIEVYIHPDYKRSDGEYNNVAILKTDRRVQYGRNIWPYCLPEKNQVFDGFVEISGWDLVDSSISIVDQSRKSPLLQKAFVKVVDKSQCESKWRSVAPRIFENLIKFSYPQGLTKQILCAGRDGVGTCRRDSGGPLLYHDSTSYEAVTVIGILAKGLGTCPRYNILPSFYTNIAHYVDWIYDTTSLPRPESNSAGLPTCKFPFIYKQATYSACTSKDDPDGKLWCSTQTDNRNNHVKDQWRHCPLEQILMVDDRHSSSSSSLECGSFDAIAHLSSRVTDRSGQNNLLQTGNGGMAAIHNSATNLGSSTLRCGASLILDRYLLTTAHCVDRIQVSLISISLGRKDLDESPFPGPDTYEVQEVYIHPDYKRSDGHKYNDLAILKTKRKVLYGHNIWPYCLPERNQVFEGFAEIAGWGQVNQTHTSPVLQKAFVKVLDNSQCESKWSSLEPATFDLFIKFSYPQGLTNQILCAGRDGVDACTGDAGGPLLHHDSKSDGTVTVIGIIANGISSCPLHPRFPGFYTNIAHYVDWIYDKTSIPRPESRPLPSPAAPQPIPPSNPTATCGRSSFSSNTRPAVSNRIANGVSAVSGEYPWMVHIKYYSNMLKYHPSCGGSLITNRFVLTAAHCFRHLEPNEQVTVKIGFLNLSHHNTSSLIFTVNPNSIFKHDEYGGSSLENDIALVWLPQDVTLTEGINTICLGTIQQIPYGGKVVTAGWGALNSSDTEIPNVLQHVELDLLPEANCTGGTNILCTYTPGKDTCGGDSGGPLMVQQNERWYQLGVLSYGHFECNKHNFPARYTRIANFMPFITNTIRLLKG